MNVRLVAVDEHVLLRLGLTRLLAGVADIDLVGTAGSIAEAVEVADAAWPDVVTFDAGLPDGDGFTLARRLRALRPTVGLVLLSATNDDATLYRALDEGLSAYAPKDSAPNAVLGAIRAGFPDHDAEVIHMVSEGDLVATYKTFTGTQTGDFFGIPATGKKATIRVMDVVRYRDGLIVEHWNVVDFAGLQAQLSAPE